MKAPTVRRTVVGGTVLVEEVVVDFDLGVGFEVIRQQHDRNRHLV